jgi:hypothetical protein
VFKGDILIQLLIGPPSAFIVLPVQSVQQLPPCLSLREEVQLMREEKLIFSLTNLVALHELSHSLWQILIAQESFSGDSKPLIKLNVIQF